MVKFAELCLASAVAGCWDASLPATLEVPLPDGTTVTAPAHSGPPSLANTTWACYRAEAPNRGAFIVRVEFGSDGRVLRFFDNAAYFPDVLGSELIPDGKTHPAAVPALVYVAESYGGENASGFGFAAPLKLFLGPIQIGSGLSYAFGEVVGDRIDGTFGYRTVLEAGSPLDVGPGRFSDEYGFYAIRE